MAFWKKKRKKQSFSKLETESPTKKRRRTFPTEVKLLASKAGLQAGTMVLFKLHIAGYALNAVLPAKLGDAATVVFLYVFARHLLEPQQRRITVGGIHRAVFSLSGGVAGNIVKCRHIVEIRNLKLGYCVTIFFLCS